MKRILLVMVCTLLLLASGCRSTAPTLVVSTPGPALSPSDTPAPTPSSEPTPTPAPTPTPVPDPTRVTVMVVGDLLCLNAQLSSARSDGEYHFDYCFDAVKSTISSADLAIGNLETLVADGYKYTAASSDAASPTPTPGDTSAEPTEPVTGEPPAEEPSAGEPSDDGASATVDSVMGSSPASSPALSNPRVNAPESFLTAVLGCGFDVLTNANNHICDYSADGIVKTLQKLDEYGVLHTGAYAAPEDKKPLIVDVNGINIAVLAYTDILNNSPGRDNAWMVDRYDEDLVTADIAAAKEAGADFIIVCMHWGTEHTHKPSSSQRKMAQFIADAGADIILGSHPHCTQPFETVETDRGPVPMLYSLGNFISSMGKTMHKDGVIVSMVLEKEHETETTSLSSLTYIPTLCTNTSAGRFVVCPADLASIAASEDASDLQKSRERTIEVLTENVAKAQ